jgi:type II secretory pathway component PulF
MRYTLANFYGEAATMLDAGVSILMVLDTSVNNSGGRLRSSIANVRSALASGMTIPEAFRSESGLFAHDVAFIEAGVASGQLPEAFRALADWHALKRRAWRSIKAGLVYPAMVLHFAAFITPFPAYFAGNITTAGYLATVGSFLAAVLYAPALLVTFVLKLSGSHGTARKTLSRLALAVPLLGRGLFDVAVARYCGAFAALHHAGVPVARCAAVSSRLCGNVAVAALFEGGAASAESGRPVSEGFSPRLPAEILAIWQTGEKSGRLSESLRHLSDLRQSAGEDRLKEFSKWLPRVVGFVVMALMAIQILGNFPLP